METAFPLNVLDQGDSGNLLSVETNRGMSLRDYFAAKAMQGLLASMSDPVENMTDGSHIDGRELTIASMAFSMADAMLTARKG